MTRPTRQDDLSHAECDRLVEAAEEREELTEQDTERLKACGTVGIRPSDIVDDGDRVNRHSTEDSRDDG